MADKDDWGDSLGDLEELLGCVADLETEDLVYLEEYLTAGEGPPRSQDLPFPLPTPSPSLLPSHVKSALPSSLQSSLPSPLQPTLSSSNQSSLPSSLQSSLPSSLQSSFSSLQSSLRPSFPSPLQSSLPSPLQPPPSSSWSGWERDEDPIEALKPLPEVRLVGERDGEDAEVNFDEDDPVESNLNRGGSGGDRPVRANRGVSLPKFVSYQTLPPSKGRELKCEVCGLRLSSRESRRRHILSRHVKERTNTCNTCGKAFVFKFALKTHQAVHASTPSHVCVCGATFNLRASYMDHVRRIHHAATAMHKCHLCFKSFHDRHTFRIHLISVHKPKTIACLHPGCPKLFSTLGLMRSHYRYHLNKKFTCDDCGQSFSTEAYMCKHRLAHRGIRPYMCLDCGRKYLSVSNLNKHRRMAHSTLRPYQCSMCGKCYKTRDHLTFHENSHRGEKPYKCEICGYATAYKNTYYAHKKKHKVSPTTNDYNRQQKGNANANVNVTLKQPFNSKVKGKGKLPKRKCVQSKIVNGRNVSENQTSSETVLPQMLDYSGGESMSSVGDVVEPVSSHSGVPSEGVAAVNIICVVSEGNNSNVSLEPETHLVEQGLGEEINFVPQFENVQLANNYLSPPTIHIPSVISQESMDVETPSTIDDNKLILLNLVTNSDLPHVKNDRTIPDKEESLIILSSLGKCVIPNCDNNDDSLVLFKSDDNYIALYSQHDLLDIKEEEIESESNFSENIQMESLSVPVTNQDETVSLEIRGLTYKATPNLSMEDAQPNPSPEQIQPSSIDATDIYNRTNPKSNFINLPSVSQPDTNPPQPSTSNVTLKYQDDDTQGDSLLHLPDTNPSQPAGVGLEEEFSSIMELDSGVASLSGHIVDDSFNLSQLEVQCPLCDQFLFMDAYVTHLENSHT